MVEKQDLKDLLDIQRKAYDYSWDASKELDSKARNLIVVAGLILSFNFLTLDTISSQAFASLVFGWGMLVISIIFSLAIMSPLKIPLVEILSEKVKKIKSIDNALLIILSDFYEANQKIGKNLETRRKAMNWTILALVLGLIAIFFANSKII